MEVREAGKWDKESRTEVYYDRIFKHYIVKNKANIEIKPLHLSASFTLISDKTSQEFLSNQFLQLQICVPRGLITCICPDNTLVSST